MEDGKSSIQAKQTTKWQGNYHLMQTRQMRIVYGQRTYQNSQTRSLIIPYFMNNFFFFNYLYLISPEISPWNFKHVNRLPISPLITTLQMTISNVTTMFGIQVQNKCRPSTFNYKKSTCEHSKDIKKCLPHQ